MHQSHHTSHSTKVQTVHNASSPPCAPTMLALRPDGLVHLISFYMIWIGLLMLVLIVSDRLIVQLGYLVVLLSPLIFGYPFRFLQAKQVNPHC